MVILGSVLLLIPDVLVMIGVKIYYLEFNKIYLYFNDIFVQNNNIYIFVMFAPLLGYVVFYSPFTKFFALVYTAIVIACFSLIVRADFGNSVAEALFLKQNQTVIYQHKSYLVDVYYHTKTHTYLKTSLHGDMKKIKNEELSR